ncbi:ABC transporter permease [Nonomuraea jiangxiensis]|uniref:NitT/TauT family transport system permease protein n=1 Tax=Nonomuraea jiangxiensis TaxID=633440 RepID=A0A1G8VJ35_9ACTN|nr:ABC transporter permease subunit [Nonomuraea jiangxiensis]SDJ66003.1 NitT/TauT family transport system permease protein [Nonomuraea jiangxiensis]
MTATVIPARRERNPLARARLIKFSRHAAGVAGFLVLWQVVGMSGLVKWLPPAADTLARTVSLAVDPDFLADLQGTLLAAAIGLPLAILIAVPLGLLLGTVPVVEEMTRVFVEFLRPIPSVALIPLALFFFQPEINAKVALIVFAASWPILINTMYGVRDVDPLAKETLRSYGFGPAAVIWRVALPSAAPFIATGVRLAASITLILAISVEYVVGGAVGIGGFLIEASTGIGAAAMIDVIAALLWAGFIGLVVNTLLVRAEQRLFRWRTA